MRCSSAWTLLLSTLATPWLFFSLSSDQSESFAFSWWAASTLCESLQGAIMILRVFSNPNYSIIIHVLPAFCTSLSLLVFPAKPFHSPSPWRHKTHNMFVVSLPKLIRFVLWPLVLQNCLQVATKSLKFTWLLEGAEGSGRCWEYFNQRRKELENGFLLLLYCRVIMRSGICTTAFKHDNSANSCTGPQSAIEGGLTSVIFLFHPWATALPTKQQELIWILFGKY